MQSTNKYQRITDEENANAMEVELPSVNIEPTAPVLLSDEKSQAFTIKIMFKESTHVVTSLSEQSSITELKALLEPVFDIPSNRQRFIFAGKQLKPDDKSLSSFKVYNNASIHLFPLPAPTAPTAVSVLPAGATAVGGTSYNPIVAVQATPEFVQSPVHFDPFVSQTSREVKLWCLILLFLSAMTLFNNLSYMSSTGKVAVERTCVEL